MDSPITVFRSADESAGDDAAEIQQMLADQGIEAAIVDDKAPGVPAGCWEVRVAAADQARADELVSHYSSGHEPAEVDASADLDLVTVFGAGGGQNSEMEAMEVQSLLEAGGFTAFLIGDSRFPNLGQEVRVPRDQEAAARQMIADALAAGPQAAEEASEESQP